MARRLFPYLDRRNTHMSTLEQSIRLRPPFANYQLDAAYDEMFAEAALPRPEYLPLFKRLLDLEDDELRERQQTADIAFLNQGITFTVYGSGEGTERIFPYDLLPRIITADEWATLERGLT